MDMNNKRTFLERFYNFMEQDTRAVEILTYGIAGVGLITAVYKIKPFTKFRKPSDVPYHFIQNKVILQGSVTRVELNNGSSIYVDHKPLINLPRFTKQNSLPIKIEGVDINTNGFSWLQSMIVGKDINFIPLSKEKEFLSCIVMLPQKNQEALSIGEELVKLGFGTTHTIDAKLLHDEANVTYQKSLEVAQKRAKRKRNGIWHFKIPPTLSWKLQNYVSNRIESIPNQMKSFITQ